MAESPPLLIYAMVLLAALLENIVPPTPSDVIVALAAFLSHRGTTSATAVFLVTWVGSVAGALLVYLLARHLGQRFVTGRLGRRLITPEAVVAVERHYLRYGLVGLFIARMLPGFRSFTAPFAGLVRLTAPRALLPMAVASGLWYGGIVFVAARLGRSWDGVTRLLNGIYQTMGILATLAAAALVVWAIRARQARRRRQREQLRQTMEPALRSSPGMDLRALDDPAVAAVAALLLETSWTGEDPDRRDLEMLERHLRSAWGFGAADAAARASAVSIVEELAPADRVGAARRFRDLAFAEGLHTAHEQHVMERVARVLGLDKDQLAQQAGPNPDE